MPRPDWRSPARWPRRRARIRSLPAVLVAVLMLLLTAGCGRVGLGATLASSGATGALSAITVTGEPGAKPIVHVPAPFSVPRTQSRVITAGTGPRVHLGQRVTVQYLGINGTDGKQFDTSWGRGAATFVLNVRQYLPGLVTGLVGVPVGSRVLVAVAPQDGYGVQGAPAVGIGPTDTLVVVVDLESARDVLSGATGTPVPPKPGLPTVRPRPGGSPAITVPRGLPPAGLVVQPLVQGRGPRVQKSQQVTVNYTGVIWSTGKVFDSSWQRGQPSVFPIGVGRVLTGWDLGLVGQPVGSRVLLVIPPDDGYGANGDDSFGIRGTDTLVFVVDILDAA